MFNLLKSGEKWLERTLLRHASIKMLYRRGSSSASVRAVPGATAYKIEDADGLQTSHRQNDYLVAIADLVLDGIPISPQSGDQLVEGPGRTGDRIFEVMGIGGQEEFVEEGNYHKSYRIHTKLVGTI